MKFRAAVALASLLALAGCAARRPVAAVIPRECMGAAKFTRGECEPNPARGVVTCKGVDLEMPIYCWRFIRGDK
jgi:hypothetical protein